MALAIRLAGAENGCEGCRQTPDAGVRLGVNPGSPSGVLKPLLPSCNIRCGPAEVSRRLPAAFAVW